MVSVWVLAQHLHTVAGPVVMLLYPLYASIKAIESPFKEDDQQWLTYWVLYSFVALVEMAADRIFAWIPMWYSIKLAAACWLALPQFRGAAFVYDEFVKKHIRGNTDALDEKLTPQQRRFLQMMSPEARTSVAKYISDYGQDAFDKIIKAADHEAKKHHLSPPSAGKSNSLSDAKDATSIDNTDLVKSNSSFRNYCRQHTKHLRQSFHRLESRTKDLRTRYLPQEL